MTVRRRDPYEAQRLQRGRRSRQPAGLLALQSRRRGVSFTTEEAKKARLVLAADLEQKAKEVADLQEVLNEPDSEGVA